MVCACHQRSKVIMEAMNYFDRIRQPLWARTSRCSATLGRKVSRPIIALQENLSHVGTCKCTSPRAIGMPHGVKVRQWADRALLGSGPRFSESVFCGLTVRETLSVFSNRRALAPIEKGIGGWETSNRAVIGYHVALAECAIRAELNRGASRTIRCCHETRKGSRKQSRHAPFKNRISFFVLNLLG